MPPQTRSMARRLATEANTIITRNVAKAVVGSVLNIANPSQRQAAVLQLLGDAKEDREGLLQRLVPHIAQSLMTINSPTALFTSTDKPSNLGVQLRGKTSINGQRQ